MRSITSRKPITGDPLAFARGWLRAPLSVGGPFASSPWTAERIADATSRADCGDSGPVVEIGAGTGPVTEALLRLGCPPERLIVIERDAEMCAFLEDRFPRLRILHGDALRLRETLGQARITSISVTLSGLPIRVVPDAAARRFYREAFGLMPEGGALIQYTYGLRAPLDPPSAATLDLDATFVGREWRNLPPMAIWRYRRRAVPVYPVGIG